MGSQNYGVAAGTPEEDVGGDGSRRRFTTAEFFSMGFDFLCQTHDMIISLFLGKIAPGYKSFLSF